MFRRYITTAANMPIITAAAFRVCFIFSIVSNSRIISHRGEECRIIARSPCPGIIRRSCRKCRKTLQRFQAVRMVFFCVGQFDSRTGFNKSLNLSLCYLVFHRSGVLGVEVFICDFCHSVSCLIQCAGLNI